VCAAPTTTRKKESPALARIKKRGGGERRERWENSIYAALPYFSICYVYTPPRSFRGLARFFFFFRFYEIPFIFERDSRRSPYMLTRKKGRTRAQKWTRTPIAECAFRHLIRDRTAPINNPIRASGREKKKKERNRGRSG